MSTHSIVRSTLAVAFTLTVAGSALARRPPALERQQAAAERALSACTGSGVNTGGYRGMLARAETKSAPAQARATLEVMGDHVVVLCAGTKVHAPGGYRDLDRRFKAQPQQLAVARAQPNGQCVARR